MKKSTKLYVVIFCSFCFFLLTNCVHEKNNNSNIFKPNADKEYGDLLFALNKKYWNSKIGKTIEREFEKLVKQLLCPLKKNTILILLSLKRL